MAVGKKTRTTRDPIGINSKRNGMITKTQKPELIKNMYQMWPKIQRNTFEKLSSYEEKV